MLTRRRLWQIGEWRSSCSNSVAKRRASSVKRAFDGQNTTNNGLMYCQIAQVVKYMLIEPEKNGLHNPHVT